jgi:hypothetical protein
MDVCMRGRGTAAHILKIDTRWWLVFSCAPAAAPPGNPLRMQVGSWVSARAGLEGFGDYFKTLPGFEPQVVEAVA